MKQNLKYFFLLLIPFMASEAITNNKAKLNLEILNNPDEDTMFYQNKPKSKLDLEDEKYIRIRQRNLKDKILPNLTLELAQKHIEIQEYLVAQYYIKIYLQEYSFSDHLDKAWYLGLKSLFMKFKISESQKDFLKEITRISKGFSENFPRSKYTKEALKMLNEARIIQYNRNEEIANYYEKIGKIKAAKLYHSKNNNALIKLSPLEIKLAKQKRIKKIKSDFDVFDDEDSY